MKKPKLTSATGGDSTWGKQPASEEWNTETSWSPPVVPTNKAIFGDSSRKGIEFLPNSNATVDTIEFDTDAPVYTFLFNSPAPDNPALAITGKGVFNYSTNIQRFVVASTAKKYINPQLKFMNSATAGGIDISYSAGPTTPQSAGGGVIGFYDKSTAGAASFTVTTGAGTPPKNESTVGGEVGFSDSSSAGTARFIIHGSTSTTDGDTFGNTAFHDTSSADNAVFTNTGGTVSGGDGGNTQFFDNSTSANGLFHNMGGTVGKANGGDVAIDSTANAANGNFHNYAATASGGYGGVTSFNNNYPNMKKDQGASAGSGSFFNYGATASGQGAGHTFFTSKFGSASAGKGNFFNYGSAVSGSASTAGHTVFSISLPQKIKYRPNAANAVFWNFPGTSDDSHGGYTEFTVYTDNNDSSVNGDSGPTAGNATFINLGAVIKGARGGLTSFGGSSGAENAQLIAFGGSNGGQGGQIAFYEVSTGGKASVQLYGNSVLDISNHTGSLTIGNLELAGGNIETSLGSDTTCLILSEKLAIKAVRAYFYFESGKGFKAGTSYTVLTAPNLSDFKVDQFAGNSGDHGSPIFAIEGNNLQVSFKK